MTPLKRARLADPRKLAQGDVADAVGITQTFYLRIENGERAASREVAESIAELLGLPLANVFEPTRYISELEPETAEA